MFFEQFISSVIIVCILIVIICDNNVAATSTTSKRPHIILILVDDLGLDDVSYHGSNQIPTPNIDALGYHGIILNKFYTAPMCSPSRASLLTGKYASNVGMQHYVIASEQPWGLPLNEKLLPEYMRDGGYSTHLIGKWHMGFYRKAYTPTLRGFDSHFGYVGPYVDYWDHTLLRTGTPYVFDRGLDMRENLTINYNTKGKYATDLFTEYAINTINKHNKEIPLFMFFSHLAPHAGNTDKPLQAPEEDVQKFSYIKDMKRRIYAAMVSKLDDSVGQLIQAIKQNDMLNNTIILFISDNGSPTIGENANSGSNFPLRGQKDAPWEGATRTNAIIWSATLDKKERISNELYHITDIFKTLIDIANVNNNTDSSDAIIDGLNIWESLSKNIPSPRKEVLCNYDKNIGYISYINENWKFINGTTYNGLYDYWISDDNARYEVSPQSKIDYAKNVFHSNVSMALLPYSKLINTINYESHINTLLEHCQIICLSSSIPINSTTFRELEINKCNPLVAPCLFNLDVDPCEENNLYSTINDSTRIELENRINKHIRKSIDPRNKPSDPRSNPSQFNNTWTWWFDELDIDENHNIAANALCLSYIILLNVILLHLLILD